MNFNNHSNLEGQHAFLGASKYHWINYGEDKVAEAYRNFLATQKGTVLHAFAAQCIMLNQKLPKSKQTLNMYVNDAIGFKMTPEQILYYSDNCFGTADAILFRNNFLRIHDLKTGKIPAHMEQLEIYAALFCLEYKVKPGDIEMELRIYQNNEILYHNPTAEDIVPIMDRIITFDKVIKKIREQEGYAPNYKDGETVALIRYPHGGTFEIPILKVNNKLAEGKSVLGNTPADAIGINKKNADRLSGADFDGDTVMVIPCNSTKSKVKITSTSPLKGLEGFDTKDAYGGIVKKDADGVDHYYRIETSRTFLAYRRRRKAFTGNRNGNRSVCWRNRWRIYERCVESVPANWS